MVNIPRALFTSRTGREPRYHVAIEELQGWAYTGKPLVPLKGYPGIVWERPKSRKRTRDMDHVELLDRRILSTMPVSFGEGICIPEISKAARIGRICSAAAIAYSILVSALDWRASAANFRG